MFPSSSPEGPGIARPRRLGLWVAIIIGLGAVAAAISLFSTPIRVSAAWWIDVRSGLGAPVEIYIGDERLGVTPISIAHTDPRWVEVDLDYDLTVRSAFRMLEAIGVTDLEPLGEPNALPPGTVGGGVCGGLGLGSDPAAGTVSLYWWSALVRRSDGSLELVYPLIVEDEIHGTRQGCLLRARRGGEVALDGLFGTRGYTRHDFRRTLLRSVDYEFHGTIAFGPNHDMNLTAAQHGGGEWWLAGIPVGTERLDEGRE